MTKLKFVKPENYSGFSTQWAKYLPIIKKKDYVVRDISVGGDQGKRIKIGGGTKQAICYLMYYNL